MGESGVDGCVVGESGVVGVCKWVRVGVGVHMSVGDVGCGV